MVIEEGRYHTVIHGERVEENISVDLDGNCTVGPSEACAKKKMMMTQWDAAYRLLDYFSDFDDEDDA